MRKTNKDKIRETNGVHLLIAPYMGMFIPCKANKLKAECKTNKRLAGRKFLPSLNEYRGKLKEPVILEEQKITNFNQNCLNVWILK